MEGMFTPHGGMLEFCGKGYHVLYNAPTVVGSGRGERRQLTSVVQEGIKWLSKNCGIPEELLTGTTLGVKYKNDLHRLMRCRYVEEIMQDYAKGYGAEGGELRKIEDEL